jgi:hypothetical protein
MLPPAPPIVRRSVADGDVFFSSNVHENAMLARVLVFFAVTSILVCPPAARAQSQPRSATSSVPAAPTVERPRDAGALDGRIASIDYVANTMRVAVRGRGLLTFSIEPTTPITALNGGNAMMIDLKPHAHVVIESNRTGDRYVAQNIKIVK